VAAAYIDSSNLSSRISKDAHRHGLVTSSVSRSIEIDSVGDTGVIRRTPNPTRQNQVLSFAGDLDNVALSEVNSSSILGTNETAVPMGAFSQHSSEHFPRVIDGLHRDQQDTSWWLQHRVLMVALVLVAAAMGANIYILVSQSRPSKVREPNLLIKLRKPQPYKIPMPDA